MTQDYSLSGGLDHAPTVLRATEVESVVCARLKQTRSEFGPDFGQNYRRVETHAQHGLLALHQRLERDAGVAGRQST